VVRRGRVVVARRVRAVKVVVEVAKVDREAVEAARVAREAVEAARAARVDLGRNSRLRWMPLVN